MSQGEHNHTGTPNLEEHLKKCDDYPGHGDSETYIHKHFKFRGLCSLTLSFTYKIYWNYRSIFTMNVTKAFWHVSELYFIASTIIQQYQIRS